MGRRVVHEAIEAGAQRRPQLRKRGLDSQAAGMHSSQATVTAADRGQALLLLDPRDRQGDNNAQLEQVTTSPSFVSEDERRPDTRDQLLTRGSLRLLDIDEGWWHWNRRGVRGNDVIEEHADC